MDSQSEEGLEVSPNENIMLADEAPAFAQAVITLLHNAPRRAQMAQNGLKLLRESYTSQVNTVRVKRQVEETLSKSAFFRNLHRAC